MSFEIGAGPVVYNESDVGRCPPLDESDETLATTPIEGTIDWPGVQGHGPSDTNQPFGPVFPDGDYKVSVEIDVPGKGRVGAKLSIHVVSETLGTSACEVGDYVYGSGDQTVPRPCELQHVLVLCR